MIRRTEPALDGRSATQRSSEAQESCGSRVALDDASYLANFRWKFRRLSSPGFG